MAEIIGIDLGTTNSVLAHLKGAPEVINIKGRPTLPSVIAYNGGQWIVGQSAKNLAVSSDDVLLSPKRKMGTDYRFQLGGQTVTPVAASAMILKELKLQAEQSLGEAVDTAVITIPAYFNQQQVDDTRRAAEQAGLKVGKLLAEPVAAAATYGSGGEETILVFDLGGGTLDCTVVDTFDAKILGLSGDNWLGGDDFDRRIVDRMAKILLEESQFDVSKSSKALAKLKQKAEEAKINLSEMDATQVEFIGKLDGKLCQVEFRLTRDDYHAMIKDLVDRALEKADEAIERANREHGVTREDIDVILLVGGSTLTPYVQERLQQHFGKVPSKRVDPMLAVGLGAAICTRDVPWDDSAHRVILRSRAEVWPQTTYTLRGRTTGRSSLEATGAAAPVQGTADAEGRFTLDVNLKPNEINEISVSAASPSGQKAKAVQRIRHDAGADVAAEEPADAPVIAPTLPRNILLGLTDNEIAVVFKAGTTLPASYQEADRFCCLPNAAAFTLQGPVYEGHMPEHEIPYAAFNTYMGTLEIKCPPTGAVTPLVVAFEIDESRNMTFKAWFKDDPSVSNQITLKSQSLSKDKWHLIERVDTAINTAGERIRPDERTKINHKKQALIDLCEQYAAAQEQSPEAKAIRERIVQTGNELKTLTDSIEKKYGL